MRRKIAVFCMFLLFAPLYILAQCDDDDDDLPTGSISADGGGCAPAIFTISFSLSANDDDDDTDVFNVRYSVGGQGFTLNGISDGHTVRHTLTTSGTAVLSSVTYAGCTISINQSVALDVSAGPSLSLTPSSPSCTASNGSLLAQASGGASPYEYSLDGGNFQASGSFSGLAAGSYSVTVRDANGCTNSRSQTLSSGAAPSLSISSVNQPGCSQSNGSFTSQGSGGTSPYQYSLNGGNFQASGSFSGLAAGSYSVTVRDANGCTNSRSQTLSSGAAPSLNISSVNQPGCSQSNGSFTSQGSGGTSPYQYSLNGGNFQASGSFSGLAAGSYSVTVRDANGCTNSSTQVLSSPNAPSLSTSNVSQPGCNQSNGAFTAQGTGGVAPYQFSLNNGTFQAVGNFGNLAAGTYTISIRDANACSASTTVILQNPASPQGSVANLRQPTCAGNDGQIQVQAQGGASPYSFSLNNAASQNNGIFSNLAPGNYNIRIQDSQGCQTTITATLNSATGNLASASIMGTIPNNICLLEEIRLQGNLPAGTSGRWTSSNNLSIFSNPNNAQTTVRVQQAGMVELIWSLSAPGCNNYSQTKVQVNILPLPQAKNFGEYAVNKEPFIVDLDPSLNLVELEVLRQGKKGTASIGLDDRMVYTPRKGESGTDTIYYILCDARCLSSCDTAWVAFRLENEDAICELEKIDPRAIFPEGITPNSDGFNDALVFRIVDKLGCPTNYAESDITIFNRWGDKVFVQEPYENQWVGNTNDGQVLPPGVYYYVLRIRPQGRKEFVKFGSVAIFK